MSFTDWNFSLSSEDAWEKMLDACDAAKISIDMEQFIFIDGEIGRRFIDVFAKKAAEGVRVRLLLDTAGCFSIFGNGSLVRKLRKAGAEVRFFHEIKPWRITRFKIWFFRDHRKLLVVDREVAFVGGVGIADQFVGWRDTNVRVTGDTIVTQMQSAFDHMWWVSGRDRFGRFPEPRQTADGFRVVTNAPHFRQRLLHRTFIESIRNAKEYIYLTTPYFVPDGRFFRVLRLAARRGVDVKIIVPESSDHPYVDYASHSHFHKAFQAGIRIFQYRGRFIHAKSIVIDGDWSSVGSSNVDNLSSFFNHEINLVSVDRRFTEELRGHFLTDLKSCVEVSPKTWHQRGIFRKTLEFFCAPFGRFF